MQPPKGNRLESSSNKEIHLTRRAKTRKRSSSYCSHANSQEDSTGLGYRVSPLNNPKKVSNTISYTAFEDVFPDREARPHYPSRHEAPVVPPHRELQRDLFSDMPSGSTGKRKASVKTLR